MDGAALEIPGYQLVQEIGRGAMSVVYRAIRAGEAYAVKVMKHTGADRSVDAALRFRREAAAMARLNHPGLVKILEVNESQGRPYLVMELVDGEELSQILQRGPLSETKLIQLVRVLAGALGEVHRRGLVHRDIKPANIIVGKLGGAKIIDFGFVTAAADPTRDHDDVVGTFLYAAPEQTGMLKRPVDGRADLYALGAVLFECVAGHPPFQANTVAELMRLHAAVLPQRLSDLTNVRPVLSDIIGKLLSKDPDDRYQTAEGLIADVEQLQQLEEELRQGKRIRLGSHDISPARLQELPLSGRDREFLDLKHLWSRAQKGNGAAILVEGEGGSGKTRLIREIIRTAQSTGRPLILAGKCQQSERIPFGPFREAIDEHVGRVIRMPPEEKQLAIQKLKSAVGEAEIVLKRLSRGMEVLLTEGEKSSKPEMAIDVERFYGGLVDFLVELSKQYGQALILVDDVQWLDEASFEVVVRLSQKLASSPILLAGTSRNDPASEASRQKLVASLADRIIRMVLAPLDLRAVGKLIAAQLGGGELDKRVVERIASRANGNPFAVGQYVRALLDAGVVSPVAGNWAVDPKRLEELALPEDVLELVVNRAATLSPKTTRVLGQAAIIGMHFERALLLRVTAEEDHELLEVLNEAKLANLIEQIDSASYEFVHDRVREALAKTLSDDEICDVHQRVAESLEHVEDRSPEHFFSLARHYARGHTGRNPQRVYETNLIAGKHALASHAYGDALNFLKDALHASSITSSRVTTSPELEEALGQACLGTAKINEAIEHFERVLLQVTDPLVRARIHTHLIRVHISRMDARRTWAECLKALEALGRPWPTSKVVRFLTTVFYWTIAWFCDRTGWLRGRAKGGNLAKRKALAAIYAFSSFGVAMVGMRPKLRLQVMPRLALNVHLIGDIREAVDPLHLYAVGAACMGLRTASMRAITRAKRIAEQIGDPALLGMVTRNLDWSHHFLGDNQKAEEIARQTLTHFGKYLLARDYLACCNDVGQNMLLRGHVRPGLELTMMGIDRANKTDKTLLASGNANIHGVTGHILAVLGDFNEATRFLQEAQNISKHLPPDDVWVRGWLAWHTLGFYLEQDEIGEPVEKEIADFEKFGISPKDLAFHQKPIYLFTALARLKQFERASKEKRPEALRKLRRAMRDLRAAHNVQDRCHIFIIQAAIERNDGKIAKALRLLLAAERLAAKVDSVWGLFEVAVERARIANLRGDREAGNREATVAHGMALEHGWKNRARRVEFEFKIERPKVAEAVGETTTQTNVTDKFARALSERYLKALLEVSLASASALDPKEQARAALDEVVRLLGAERAFLFLCEPETGELKLQAGRDANKKNLKEAKGYATTVVTQVKESLKPIVITGTEEGALLGSQSAVAHELRSIIAAPLMLREKLIGVVYLDNRLVKGLFKQDDVEILLAISNHIAVAVETARTARLEVERKSLEKEMEVTAAVQTLFLPKSQFLEHANVKVAGFYRPAEKCGGDWWWYDNAAAQSVSILVGDVTGHGAASAMVTAVVATGYRVMQRIAADRPLPDRLRELNSELLDICRGEYRMTLAAVQIGANTGKIEYWSAGAPPLFLLQADGEVIAMSCAGTPLGSEAFQLGAIQRDWKKGDRLFIFTDGLPELTLPTGRQLGVKRLARMLKETRDTTLEGATQYLVKQLDVLQQGTVQEDDITFAIMEHQ